MWKRKTTRFKCVLNIYIYIYIYIYNNIIKKIEDYIVFMSQWRVELKSNRLTHFDILN